MFPERFSNLPAYAFPRLRALLDVHEPGGDVLHMTIGEPKHPFPAWIGDIIAEHMAEFGNYPANDGTDGLRRAICGWVGRRYGVTLDHDAHVVALNGTREGLYNAAMALCPESKGSKRPVVLLPNPFYQVYMVAALSVGAEPVFVPATRETGYLPDYAGLPDEVLNRVVAAYLCSPSNPQGAVADEGYWRDLIGLAERYDFQVFADECYAEIYRDAPPPGALAVAADMGADPERMVTFHSLSKRSNLPGLRSGFVAGGPESVRRIKQLRAYSGAPLSGPLQRVAEAIWADDAHVVENRRLYGEKYAAADEIMQGAPGYAGPRAGFFLWLPVADGEAAALRLWRETGVRVLPGAYLGRESDGRNPGKDYIRVAMVAPIDEMTRGLTALRDCLYT
ncbi:aminotransferase class I/II-fold pyridoxal phosphate-dependent enzyme [Roseovarius spongiae]|uniref:Aminotransferase class I/II-fold pyridoxal phosphate-dependent enzyme n=1 Tax=Roseovarius spongiae TaxID=2320272 RepID=A0A3A8ATA1_9RHOB|nr:aminotransferase class I/II-fold pyridoxal phosphate-dependent enzyme [Roseovarius spongiae]RKF13820.1 aminotransferase class I/II-fold pyridoxal phosphate-dependent enzyme [Roseovarius spongiae]